jgi:hypothetical protein
MFNKVSFGILLFLLIFSGIFFACREGRRTYPIVPPEEQTRAYLKIINTAASYPHPPGSGNHNPSLDFKYETYNSSAVVARNLQFPGGWPSQGYANLIEAGVNVDSNGTGQLFLSANLNQTWVELMKQQVIRLEGEKKHTAWIIDSAQTLIARQTFDSYTFTDTTAAIRFYHANAYDLQRDLMIKFRSPRSTGDTCVFGVDSIFQNNCTFTQETPFYELKGDRTYDLFVMGRDSTTTLLSKSGITLKPKSAYALFYYQTSSGAKDFQLIRIE